MADIIGMNLEIAMVFLEVLMVQLYTFFGTCKSLTWNWAAPHVDQAIFPSQ
jgi:hypothetical protein